jgi:hypothetical protein
LKGIDMNMSVPAVSREAIIEALHRCGAEISEANINMIVNYAALDPVFLASDLRAVYHLACVLDELWQARPDKRPVDKRVVAMRCVLAAVSEYFSGPGLAEEHRHGMHDLDQVGAVSMSMLYDRKLKELTGEGHRPATAS